MSQVLKGRKILAQGKRGTSAALGHEPKMISSFLLPDWRSINRANTEAKENAAAQRSRLTKRFERRIGEISGGSQKKQIHVWHNQRARKDAGFPFRFALMRLCTATFSASVEPDLK